MALGKILSNYTYLFVLILIRYIGLFLLAPVFGSRVIPVRVKIGLAFFLSIITLPLLANSRSLMVPVDELIIFIDIIRELSIGFTIGFIAYLSFAAIQLAGRFIDLRMGFAIVNVADPVQGDTMPLMGQFKNILAVFLFLSINGHHLLLQALYHSFELIPLGGAVFNSMTMEYIFRTTGNLFLLAFKIALPVIATLFIADIIFGFLVRTIPQMNIFIVGLPLKILIGFIVLMFSLHFIIYCFRDLFQDMYEEIFKLIGLLS
ncbi:MAG: flagellar biosynthesis protein FliR [Halanaerobiales bacterium]|nr:flagellar biosynthesis protein FliR [Halanaerobiales bacterium]